MKKRVFISQPMFGKTNQEIYEERKALKEYLENKGYEVVDSILSETPPQGDNEALFYLSKSIELLSQSDYACFMPGWETARGCKIEYECATQYGIVVMEYGDLDAI